LTLRHEEYRIDIAYFSYHLIGIYFSDIFQREEQGDHEKRVLLNHGGEPPIYPPGDVLAAWGRAARSRVSVLSLWDL
jgi:hypothetical protein